MKQQEERKKKIAELRKKVRLSELLLGQIGWGFPSGILHKNVLASKRVVFIPNYLLDVLSQLVSEEIDVMGFDLCLRSVLFAHCIRAWHPSC